MPAPNTDKLAVLELNVKNHPGVMSHVCGLFARRAYNVEGIACLPQHGPNENGNNGEETSIIWLMVHEDGRLAQIIKQVEKLHDVRHVRHHGPSHPVFSGLEGLMAGQ